MQLHIYLDSLYLWTTFLLLDYKINVAEEKKVKSQTKLHQTILRGSVWVGVSGKNL